MTENWPLVQATKWLAAWLRRTSRLQLGTGMQPRLRHSEMLECQPSRRQQLLCSKRMSWSSCWLMPSRSMRCCWART